jgi:PilZ domain/SPOR domain
MITAERRQVPRTTLEKLAYINIEPNNGAIVLNVSDEGLCFHSIAPVACDEPFRFSLQDHNRRIEASGELLWTDEMQKVGGLRFSTLSSAARGQIRGWIAEPQSQGEQTIAKLKLAVRNRFRRFGGKRFSLGSFGRADLPRAAGLALPLSRPTVTPGRLRGFSSGLVTGFLVSALLASVFISSNVYRRQFGRSLIHLGERLVATAEVQSSTPTLPTNAAGVLPKDGSKPTAEVTHAAESPAVPAKHAEPAAQSASPPVKPLVASRQAVTLKDSAADREGASFSRTLPADVEKIEPPASFALLAGAVSPEAILPAKTVTVPLVLAGSPAPRGEESGSLLAMYLDVGRFKNELLAQNLSERVAQLGLHTTVTRKGHLWSNAYQVLVGPYGNEQEEAAIEGELRSNGYKPRPFERGSRDFEFATSVVVNASKLPTGDLIVSWESYVKDAKVKFTQGRNIMTTTDATWIERPYKYGRNEYVYIKQGNGSRTLVELHFSGLSRALTFAN